MIAWAHLITIKAEECVISINRTRKRDDDGDRPVRRDVLSPVACRDKLVVAHANVSAANTRTRENRFSICRRKETRIPCLVTGKEA